MDLKKFIVAVLGVGVTVNIYDFVVHNLILGGTVYKNYTTLFRMDTPAYWMIIGDFVSALVLVWVYTRVCGSFSGGWKGGATYGLYAGILVNFPTWIFIHLILAGVPYQLTWIWTIAGIGLGIIGGAVAGLLYDQSKVTAS